MSPSFFISFLVNISVPPAAISSFIFPVCNNCSHSVHCIIYHTGFSFFFKISSEIILFLCHTLHTFSAILFITVKSFTFYHIVSFHTCRGLYPGLLFYKRNSPAGCRFPNVPLQGGAFMYTGLSFLSAFFHDCFYCCLCIGQRE